MSYSLSNNSSYYDSLTKLAVCEYDNVVWSIAYTPAGHYVYPRAVPRAPDGSLGILYNGIYSMSDSVAVNSCFIFNDGSHTFLSYNGHIYAFKLVSGSVSQVGTPLSIGSYFFCGTHTPTGHLVLGYSNGIYLVNFENGSFTVRQTISSFSYPVASVCCTGNFIIATSRNTVYCYEISGNTLAFCDSYQIANETNSLPSITFDGSYVYVASKTNRTIIALTLSQTGQFSYVATSPGLGVTGFMHKHLTTDGYFLYSVVCDSTSSADKIAVYRFNGSIFTQVSSLIGINVPLSTTDSSAFAVFRAPYYTYCSGDYIQSSKMNLTASFTADKLTGTAPLAVRFTAVD